MDRILRLDFNEVSQAELDGHGLTIEHVYQVFERRPFFRPQPAEDEIALDGSPRRRPPRIQMIGPDRSGRLLTIIIEQPVDETAHVVTGWEASKEQQDRYRRARGRRRL